MDLDWYRDNARWGADLNQPLRTRYYTIMGLERGHPYVAGVAPHPDLAGAGGTSIVLTREEMLAEPEMVPLLEAWERGDDTAFWADDDAIMAICAAEEVVDEILFREGPRDY